MNIDITAAAIATLISSGIATTVTLFINKRNTLKSLSEQLDDILKISVEYPYLENQKFTETWNENKDSNEDKYLRYENYCTLVFNYLERLCAYYNYSKKKIEAQSLNIRDWVRTHEQCWKNPSIPYDNIEGYNKKFRNIINSYIS
ncbi:MAG TPA: hypothetical protein PLH70_07470 [Bacteroidales bacterium]|nr:hypothetical protein [Bacteroidales bacterium]HOH22911.1 hypothetical protein [Bacteroidales bacterium]HPZ04182.1 hypothetical protein [Bacteroidales bacterium]HQB75621.1 hypothetical protein [Bacteroidales bacterium]